MARELIKESGRLRGEGGREGGSGQGRREGWRDDRKKERYGN